MTIPSAGEPRQPKQLLQNDPFSQPGYTDNFYDAVGGHETFVKLIDVFYDGVADGSAAAADVSGGGPGPREAALPDVPRAVLGRTRRRRRSADIRGSGCATCRSGSTPEAKDRWLHHMRTGSGIPGAPAPV